MTSAVTAADDRNHPPGDAASVDWQESFCLAWFDPVLRIGGFHHTGMQRVRDVADAWSWIAIDDGALFARLSFASAGETIGLSYDSGNSAIGAGHWENFGRVTGTVTLDGVEHQVNGSAFQDRSWGARDWANIFSYRWNWATFGQDLIVSVYHVVGVDGMRSLGHVFDHGEWRDVRAVDFAIEMGPDGISPLGSRVDVWMPDGGGYHLRGVCNGSSIQTHRDGFMMANACTRYTCGGRLGAGFMEVCELKRPNRPLMETLAKAGWTAP